MKIIIHSFKRLKVCTSRVFCVMALLLFVSLSLDAQNQKITLPKGAKTILSVFEEIERQTKMNIAYNESVINVNQTVHADIAGDTLGEVLDNLLKGTNKTFRIQGNQIVIVALPAKDSKKTYEGVVLDTQGESIIGASVSVKNNTSIGTITDFDGHFSIEVPMGATLVVSYVGFVPYEIKLGEQTRFDIRLKEDTKALDEVVVVGYGTQKKRDVTTSISSIRAQELEGLPVTSMAEAMVGKMPGVQVSQGSGAPGSGLQIKVRGTGTITAGTSPLYVVDGVPLAEEQLNTFNMNDVEAIEVLKDASSAAIYGSRGSNGVIMITTKKGTEGKPVLSYNGYYGVQSVSEKIDMLNAYEYAGLVKDARDNTYTDAMESINRRRAANGQSALSWGLGDNNAVRLQNTGTNYNTIVPMEIIPYLEGKKGLTDTDWQDEIFRSAGIQNHSLSVSGGTPRIKYYVSLDYLDQEGIIINSDFKRYGGRMNLEVTEGIFKFGLNFNPSITIENRVNSDGAYNSDGGGIISSALHNAPIWPVYNPDGTFNFSQNSWSANTETIMDDGSSKFGNSQTNAWNPVALALLQKDETKSTRLFGNFFGQANLLPSLTYRTNLGFDIYTDSRDRFRPSTLPLANTKDNPESEAEAKSNTSKLYNWLFENTLNYNKEIDGHSIGAIAGWTMQYERNESNYVFANGFISNDVPTLNAGTVAAGNSHASEWTLLSALARVQYSYQSRYMFSGAIRGDGSSRFGKNNRWGLFPSLSAGWRISEEKFMKSLTFLDDLKIRASYGLTGNFRIPNYGALGEISYYSYVLGGSTPSAIRGAAPSDMPNPDLKWEKTSQVNVGFDATLFTNRLTFGLDLYTSNTYDLLLNVPVPMTTGYKTRLENIGKVNNKGIELTVSTNHKWGDFTLGGHANYSKNINKVKELGPGDADIILSGSVSNAYFITRVGEAIGSYYLPVVEGVFQSQQEVDASLHYKDSPTNYGLADSKPGDFKYVDVNGDGILDILDTDRAIVGNYMPDFTYGFGINMAWKGIDLAANFQGVYGSEILNLSRRYFYNMEGNMNNYKGAVDRWKSAEDPGNGENARANRVSKGQNGVTSTWHVEDGSYLRVKNITLGYTLPKTLIRKAYLNNARVYLSMQNPFTFTKYKGYNPEVSNRASNATRTGEDYGVYPLAKTVTIGVNLTF